MQIQLDSEKLQNCLKEFNGIDSLAELNSGNVYALAISSSLPKEQYVNVGKTIVELFKKSGINVIVFPKDIITEIYELKLDTDDVKQVKLDDTRTSIEFNTAE